MTDQVNQYKTWRKRNRRILFITTVIMAVLLFIFILATKYYGWHWTGFDGGYSKVTMHSTISGVTTDIEQPQTKTLWDWLQLLLIPVSLAIFGTFLNTRSQRELAEQQAHSQRELAEQQATSAQKSLEQQANYERKLTEMQTEMQAQRAHEIVVDAQQENILQSYFSKISELLAEKHLRESTVEAEVRSIARVQTITALFRLDSVRRGNLIQFLYESGMINKGKKIIDLRGANLVMMNLSRTNWEEIELRRSSFLLPIGYPYIVGSMLSEVDLSGAILSGANLSGVDMSNANLSEADLQRSILIEVTLNQADLSRANLSRANLSRANLSRANLSGADLSGADLSGADLSGADLSGTNLIGTRVTEEQLKKAKSLGEATMPDVVGQPFSDAQKLLQSQNLQVQRVDQTSDAVRQNFVISQDRAAGTLVSPNSTVTLSVSLGIPQADLPYLIGQSFSEARETLQDLDFIVKRVDVDSDQPKGKVVNQEPKAGKVAPESQVTLYVSTGYASRVEIEEVI